MPPCTSAHTVASPCSIAITPTRCATARPPSPPADNAPHHDPYANRRLREAMDAQSAIFCPVKTEDKTLGVAVATNRPGGFGNEEVDAMTSLADAASLLISNVRLYAMLTGTVSLNPGFGPKVEASFVDELKKVYTEGFTQAEVDNAKKALLGARLLGRSTDGALLSFMVQHEQLNRPFTWDADVEAKIQSLTANDVNAAFRRHIDPNAVSIVKAGDFKAAGVYK